MIAEPKATMDLDEIERATVPACGIAVMAKASKPGRTKTRLSVVVSPEDAARCNTAFLGDIAENLLAAAAIGSIAPYMAFGPPGEDGFFKFLPPGIGLFEAWRPTFGETLAATIVRLLELGHRSACVLNADSPTLPTSILVQAAQVLAGPGDKIVLGPSRDGGYYLLGMKKLHVRLFEDIRWSTEHVAGETLERARELGLHVHLLPEWYDVDDAASFATLRGELFDGRPFASEWLQPAAARHTRALLMELLADPGRRPGSPAV
jgi:rSAM/selenodomain-associated transferase 1